jgi:hypothetical protein
MDRRTIYILTGISPNNWWACSRNRHVRAIWTKNIELFDPVAQDKTGNLTESKASFGFHSRQWNQLGKSGAHARTNRETLTPRRDWEWSQPECYSLERRKITHETNPSGRHVLKQNQPAPSSVPKDQWRESRGTLDSKLGCFTRHTSKYLSNYAHHYAKTCKIRVNPHKVTITG